MAVTEIKRNIKTDNSKIEFICPVCKSKKLLEVPKSVIAEAKQLTTMSIAKGLVCNHQFQAFVDKNFQVRGYQRVDFEIDNNSFQNMDSILTNQKQDESELFENLILEGNYLEYTPCQSKNNEKKFQKNNIIKERKMNLQEIYNEFWEFIDADNEKFRDLIIKDLRRSQTSSIY
ncbi:MAG: hypothetical protein ACFFDF_08330 [Candidatus Odinarchaeota archaeon]